MGDYKSEGIMKLLVHYLSHYKRYLLLNILGVLGFAAAELGIPTIVSHIIDEGIARGNAAYIWRMGAFILTVAILGGIGNILIDYCSARVSTFVTRDIRNDIFAKAQQYSHSNYTKFGISSMITRTTNDAFVLMQFINTILRTALLTPVMIVISVIMVLRTSLALSAIIGACIPVICLCVFFVAKISDPISTLQQKCLDTLNRITRENLTGVRVIRAFRKDRYEAERFAHANTDYVENSKKLFKLMSLMYPAFFLLLNLALIGVFLISSRMIDLGTLQVGKLVAFQEYMFHAMFSIMLFSLVFVMYPRAAVSADRIRALLEEAPEIAEPAQPKTQGDGSGTLSFEHVSFQYPDGEAPILHDISFRARRGQTVAFIGSTGSGKSTLIKLVPRLYDISSGKIRIDGIDIRDYSLSALREKIGYIPQKALLFSGTIRDNICFGKNDATDAEIQHAAEVAQAWEFITQKPEGLSEPIEEGGANLSGGQRQRLSIARALVRKPEIYIFDDAFSALDLKTDARLRKALKPETADAITLIVAQRVSSIMDADKIIVLDEGHVVGNGTHKDLLRTCDIYREIAESQLSEEELRKA